MTDAEILQAVAEVAREHLAWEGRVEPQMDLVEDLALDSLRLLILAVEVENRLQICLEREDEARIRTVGDLVATVRAKLGGSGS